MPRRVEPSWEPKLFLGIQISVWRDSSILGAKSGVPYGKRNLGNQIPGRVEPNLVSIDNIVDQEANETWSQE